MSTKEKKLKKSKKENTGDLLNENDVNTGFEDEPTTLQRTNSEPSDGVDDDFVDPDGDDDVMAKKRRKRKRKRKKIDEDEDSGAAEELFVVATASDETKSMEVDRTVYVEGIPFTATPDMVKQFFIDGGCKDITDIRLPVWHDSGRLRGYGHVVFESLDSHTRALESLSGKYIQGRYLTIQPAVKPKVAATIEVPASTTEPSKTLMLHNLSYMATEEDVQAVMEKFGTIARGGVRVVRHSGSLQSKGFCYVEFADMQVAVEVMTTTTPIQILGRPCRIDYDHGRVRGSFRTADRKLWQKEYGSTNKQRSD